MMVGGERGLRYEIDFILKASIGDNWPQNKPHRPSSIPPQWSSTMQRLPERFDFRESRGRGKGKGKGGSWCAWVEECGSEKYTP